jgi:hypothetical protein
MLYENADPFRLTEPSGVLDTSQATYTALDDRTVRVEGSRFEPAQRPSIKLEGARLGGYETMALVGIRDPHVLSRIDEWVATIRAVTQRRVRGTLGLEPDAYGLQVSPYGAGAILGDIEPKGAAREGAPPREVLVLFKVRAADQATATAIAKTANPLLLHLPLPGMEDLPSFAFATSPAEIERGAVHEFVLNHVIEVDDESELFRTVMTEVGGG